MILCGLGSWQLERKAWKDTLVAQIAERSRAAAIPVETALQAVARGEKLEYARVRASGRFHHDKARFLFAPEAGRTGWHVYVPFETATGVRILVNRGFVGNEWRQTPTTSPSTSAADVEVVGLLRHTGVPGTFTPNNDSAKNVWYWRDLAGMLGSAFPQQQVAAPLISLDVEASADLPAESTPRPGVTRLTLPNRHLEYALTWYGLAAALFGVYATFLLQRIRAKPGRTGRTGGSSPLRESR